MNFIKIISIDQYNTRGLNQLFTNVMLQLGTEYGPLPVRCCLCQRQQGTNELNANYHHSTNGPPTTCLAMACCMRIGPPKKLSLI